MDGYLKILISLLILCTDNKPKLFRLVTLIYINLFFKLVTMNSFAYKIHFIYPYRTFHQLI